MLNESLVSFDQNADWFASEKIRLIILFIFITAEVALFKQTSVLINAIPVIEYAFIGYVTLVNSKIGVWYYIAFTLLSFGFGNYAEFEGYPSNFWGLRLFGFSFNIFFSIALAVLCYVKKGGIVLSKFKPISFFFPLFIIWSLIVGLINLILNVNYLDDFLTDLMTYFPFFVYAYLVTLLDMEDLLLLIKTSITTTIIGMFLCLIFGKYFVYSVNHYVPANTFYFTLPVMLLLFRNLFQKWEYVILLALFIAICITGKYYFGGKAIIMTILLFLWLIFKQFKSKLSIVLGILISVLVLSYITHFLDYLSSFFDSSDVVGNKIKSISEALHLFSFNDIALLPTSMGNLVAEQLSIMTDFWSNKFSFFLGKGFGGGVKDVYGYLTPWAEDNMNGYKLIDASRDNFFKMHLSIYEVFVKSGVFITMIFSSLFMKNLVSRNKFKFIYFIMLFCVFYSHKEMMLLTVLFSKLSFESNS